MESTGTETAAFLFVWSCCFRKRLKLTDGGAEQLQVDANSTFVCLHALGKDRTVRFLCAPAGESLIHQTEGQDREAADISGNRVTY